MLACVVRVEAEKDGKWSLGCIFSRKLLNEDLGSFGVHKVPADATDPQHLGSFSHHGESLFPQGRRSDRCQPDGNRAEYFGERDRAGVTEPDGSRRR